MFQSLLKKASEALESESVQSVLSQASAQATAAQSAIAGRLSPSVSGNVGPTQTPPAAHGDEFGEAASGFEAAATDSERIEALAIALEKLRASHQNVVAENNSLKKNNTSLETQLKDLRLKAKLKITQLQRELDSFKNVTSSSTTTSSATATPAGTAPASPNKASHPMASPDLNIAVKRNPADVEMIESLQQKVESLTVQLSAAAKPAPSENPDLFTLREQVASLTQELVSLKSSEPIPSAPTEISVNGHQSVATLSDSSSDTIVREKVAKIVFLEAQQSELQGKLDVVEATLLDRDVALSQLTIERDGLLVQIQDAKSTAYTLRDLEGILAAKEELLTEGNTQREQLQARLTELKKDALTAQTSWEVAKRGIEADAQSAVEVLKRDLEAATRIAQGELEGANCNLKAELSRLETQLFERDAQLGVLEAQLTDRTVHVDALETQLVDREAKLAKVAAHAAKLELEAQTLQTDLAAHRTRAQNLEDTNETLMVSHQRAASDARRASDATTVKNETQEMLEAAVKEKQALKQTLGAAEEALRSAEGQGEDLAKQVAGLEATVNDLQRNGQASNVRCAEVAAEWRQARAELDEATSVVAELKAEVSAATEAKKKAEKLVAELEVDLLGLRKDREDVCGRVRLLETEISTMKVDLERTKAQLSEQISAREKADACVVELETSLVASQDELKKVETSMASAQSTTEFDSQKQELSVVMKSITKLTAAKDSAESELAVLKNQLATSKTEILDMEAEISKLKKEAVASSHRITEVSFTNDSLKTELSIAKSEASVLKEVLQKKDQDLLDLNGRISVVSKAAEESEVGKSFLMDEQIMDLKLQIANRQKEVATLQESLHRAQAEFERGAKENDDKIRKLKGLLGQASKTLQESKKTSAEKDTELERLTSEVDILNRAVQNLQALEREQKSTIERLMEEVQDEKEIAFMRSTDMAELVRVKSEFQSYKVRAHTALQQSSTNTFEAKVVELEEINTKLMREKMDARQEISALNERVQLTSTELNVALDQLSIFETQIKRYEGSSRELSLLRHEVDACNRRIETEQKLHEEALRSKDTYYRNSIDLIKQENQRDMALLQDILNSKEVDIKSLHHAVENLRGEVSAAKQESVRAIMDANRAKATAAQASAVVAQAGLGSVGPGAAGIVSPVGGAVGGGFFASMTSPGPASASVGHYSPASSRRESVALNHGARESFADLMMGTRRGSTENAFGFVGVGGVGGAVKERELLMNFEKVSELLVEAEEQIKRLMDQEKLLKEEIRKFERSEKRNELLIQKQNVEYLKNIVLSFLETDSKEQLLPVVAKVLELSPDEVKRVQATKDIKQRRTSMPQIICSTTTHVVRTIQQVELDGKLVSHVTIATTKTVKHHVTANPPMEVFASAFSAPASIVTAGLVPISASMDSGTPVPPSSLTVDGTSLAAFDSFDDVHLDVHKLVASPDFPIPPIIPPSVIVLPNMLATEEVDSSFKRMAIEIESFFHR
ncbi:hypothetical protein BC830DRAFT_1167362 [Chytriomyces sp. MP71]|nr:hypothetical protein BC830DRAFT_1167362 [Chytriomyces sp. MP71]